MTERHPLRRRQQKSIPRYFACTYLSPQAGFGRLARRFAVVGTRTNSKILAALLTLLLVYQVANSQIL